MLISIIGYLVSVAFAYALGATISFLWHRYIRKDETYSFSGSLKKVKPLVFLVSGYITYLMSDWLDNLVNAPLSKQLASA